MLACKHCGRSEPAVAFPPSAARKSDLRCLECYRAKNKVARDKDREATRKAARERQRAYRARGAAPTVESPQSARARSSRYARANPEKKRAHNAVQRAIKAGKLVRQSCEGCGAQKASAHHDDYTKRLAVRWLCSKCHVRLHRWIA